MPVLLDAMRTYFAKIKSPSFFTAAMQNASAYDRRILDRVNSGIYLSMRETQPDLSAFEAEFGIPLPTELCAYFSVYHPFIAGQHPRSPHTSECIMLFGSMTDTPLKAMMMRMQYCMKWFPHFAEELHYVPVGCIVNCEDAVLLERETGKVFVECNWDENGEWILDSEGRETEGNVYPKPLSSSLAEFICELNPYPNQET